MPFRSRADEPRGNRFTARQLTVITVAVAAAVIALPVGVYAAATTSIVTIGDPTTPGNQAHVDASGRLQVGDGSGALTVDGTVRVAPPAKPFVKYGNYSGTHVLAGPTTSAIDVTSLAVSTNNSSGSIVSLYVEQYPSTATKCTGEPYSIRYLWYLHNLPHTTPVTAAFPTPLVAPVPPSGRKNCLVVADSAQSSWTIGGYYGS